MLERAVRDVAFLPDGQQFLTACGDGVIRLHDMPSGNVAKELRDHNAYVAALHVAKDGKRYRSLGDQDITNPVASTASNIDEILAELDATKIPERAGRALDHETEDAFERLRVAGYL